MKSIIDKTDKDIPLGLKIVLFLAPTSIFIDPTNPTLIYNIVGFEDTTLGIPLTLISILITLPTIIQNMTKNSFRFLAIVMAIIFISFFNAIFNGVTEPLAMGVVWSLPFLWLSYYFAIELNPISPKVLRPIAFGTIANGLYLFAAGVGEFLIYGSLQQDGRISSNLVLPGHYQMYVYIPTMICFSFILLISITRSRIINFIRFETLIFIGIGFSCLAFMASREAILAFLLSLVMIFVINSRARLLVLCISFPAVIILFLSNLTYLTDQAAGSTYTSISKFSQFTESGQSYGGRDLAVTQYYEFFANQPLFGTGMRSPLNNYLGLYTDFPSAHNYYVDTLAWGGLALFIPIAYVVILFLYRACAGYIMVLGKGGEYILVRAFFTITIVCLLFSNNINVPLRQPLLASFIALVLYSTFVCYDQLISDKKSSTGS
ncbi:O-antigen ligase [Sphingorhabdus sp. EL138]|uniref:O-antigen ligase family protein n=1 Tax=Sphingorhabdus sp. EL138 TaxID=2073156 RepID=UPI0013A5ACC7|nr:O-antigen ligase family protein [Sphingorhabdus sp. EL138]